MKLEAYEENSLDIQTTIIKADIIKNVIKPYYGTTTLAFTFKEGIVIAVDSRATSGSYIASQTVHKVVRMNEYLLGTMAGCAADCLYWEKLIGVIAENYFYLYGKKINTSSISWELVRFMRAYKGMGLSLGTMFCGYDGDVPKIFYVDNDGIRLEHKIFSVGSGSTIAYGILDTHYKFDMTKEEAFSVAKKAIFHAAHRDAYSGGSVNLYFMDSNGWKFIGTDDVDTLAE